MGMLINYCKKNYRLSAESLVLGKLAHHLCLLSTFLVYIHTLHISSNLYYRPDVSCSLCPLANEDQTSK